MGENIILLSPRHKPRLHFFFYFYLQVCTFLSTSDAHSLHRNHVAGNKGQQERCYIVLKDNELKSEITLASEILAVPTFSFLVYAFSLSFSLSLSVSRLFLCSLLHFIVSSFVYFTA